MAPLLTAAFLHDEGKASYGVHLDSWAEWVYRDMPRTEEGGLQHITYLTDNEQQLWDDTLMMSVLPLTKIGLVLGRPHYVEEAKRQFLLQSVFLFEKACEVSTFLASASNICKISKLGFGSMVGLSTDGIISEEQDGDEGIAGLQVRTYLDKYQASCLRSQNAVAIPEFIEMLQLSETDGLRLHLVSSLVSQIDALVKTQDQESGLWHTILDDPTSYLEASATAGFAYGILKAIRLRLILKEERYITCAKKAIEGVLKNVENGELKQTSFGTPVFDNLDGYKNIPLTSMPYGQSLALLALTEHLRHTYL